MKATRRVFLGAAAATPALVTTIQSAPQPLTQPVQSDLKTIMDLMIPASEEMPSATGAGGLIYLEKLMQRDKDTAADITKALDVANAFSRRAMDKPFDQLKKEEQISVLKDMEHRAPRVFDTLRAYVYESYYTQPAVWQRIGYDFYATDHSGPHLRPFDDSLLANVRRMPKLYRDV